MSEPRLHFIPSILFIRDFSSDKLTLSRMIMGLFETHSQITSSRFASHNHSGWSLWISRHRKILPNKINILVICRALQRALATPSLSSAEKEWPRCCFKPPVKRVPKNAFEMSLEIHLEVVFARGACMAIKKTTHCAKMVRVCHFKLIGFFAASAKLAENSYSKFFRVQSSRPRSSMRL